MPCAAFLVDAVIVKHVIARLVSCDSRVEVTAGEMHIRDAAEYSHG